MKASDFDYVRVTSVADAVAVMANAGGEARWLAGGQSLIPALNFRLDRPGLLIDLNAIPALSGIRRHGDHIVIGALTRHAEVARHPLITAHLPLLAQAVQHVAHAAIRNRGTFGGSLALADPSAEMPTCALALNAVIHATGPDGPRQIPVDDFFQGSYATALAPDELLTEVHIPLPAPAARHGFAELTRRRGDYAMAGLALMTGPAPRVVWFALSDRPLRDRAAEAALSLAPAATAAAIAAAALDGIDVWGDLHNTPDTKTHLARVMLRRVLGELA